MKFNRFGGFNTLDAAAQFAVARQVPITGAIVEHIAKIEVLTLTYLPILENGRVPASKCQFVLGWAVMVPQDIPAGTPLMQYDALPVSWETFPDWDWRPDVITVHIKGRGLITYQPTT